MSKDKGGKNVKKPKKLKPKLSGPPPKAEPLKDMASKVAKP
jgi:hypothetical protein